MSRKKLTIFFMAGDEREQRREAAMKDAGERFKDLGDKTPSNAPCEVCFLLFPKTTIEQSVAIAEALKKDHPLMITGLSLFGF